MKNALGYCRVSGRSQKDGTSLDEQEEQIDVWAHANGYTIIECFRDVVSGEKPWQDRPGALALIERLAHNGIDAVIVHQLDRVGRGKSAIFENFLEAIVELGVQVISVVDGKLTPDSSLDEFQQADHDMLLSIKMAIIRQEKRKLVARMKIGKLRKAKTGARVNGIYPYGDDPRRPEETATLQKMRELRSSGATCYAIAQHLNKKNMPPRNTGAWTPWAVQKILDRQS